VTVVDRTPAASVAMTGVQDVDVRHQI